jgi:hypothetical protein
VRRDIVGLSVWAILFGAAVFGLMDLAVQGYWDGVAAEALAALWSGAATLVHAHRISTEIDDRDLMLKYARFSLTKESGLGQ